MAQRLRGYLQSAHGAHRPKHVRRVTALPSTGLQQAARLGDGQDRIEEPALRAVCEEPRAELAEHGVIKADVGELQAEHVLPVDPGAHRVGGLPVGQPFHELQERYQGEADRRLGRLPAGRKEIGEVVILDEHVQDVEQAHDEIARREDRPRDLRGLVRHHVRALRIERHHRPPASSPPATPPRCGVRGPSSRRRSRAEFATNIKVWESRFSGVSSSGARRSPTTGAARAIREVQL